MTTRSQSQEAERRALESEKHMGEMLMELSQRQEVLHKQSLEQRQEARAQTARTEARFDELLQVITAMSLQNQAMRQSEKATPAASGGGGAPNIHGESNVQAVRNNWGKSTRLEFPKFDGDGFDGWIMRADYFFEVAEVPENERVKVAALHLEAKALQWHRGYIGWKGEAAYEDWKGYIAALAAQFGAQAYEDPLADLRNLKQVSTLQSYMDSFDELCPRTGIREDQALSFFLSGLINELQMPVRMFKPKTLADAYALAKLQELTVVALNNQPKAMPKPSQYTTAFNSNVKPLSVTTSAFKPATTGSSGVVGERESNKQVGGAVNLKSGPRLTSKEMDDKRSKGLCFWYEEKYTPAYRCPKKKLYVIQMLERDVEEDEEGMQWEEGEDTPSELHLSLHAMWGLEGTVYENKRGMSKEKAADFD